MSRSTLIFCIFTILVLVLCFMFFGKVPVSIDSYSGDCFFVFDNEEEALEFMKTDYEFYVDRLRFSFKGRDNWVTDRPNGVMTELRIKGKKVIPSHQITSIEAQMALPISEKELKNKIIHEIRKTVTLESDPEIHLRDHVRERLLPDRE